MELQKNPKKYYIIMLLSIIIFSTFEVVTKTMNGAISGVLLTFYRFFIGGAVLLPFAIRDIKKRKIKFTSKYILLFFCLGFMLVFVSMTIAQYGVFLSSANISAVLFSSNPLFISLFSSIILKEKLNLPKILGLVIGIIGLVITCSNLLIPHNVSSSFILGVCLTLISMLVFSIYTVISKKISINGIGPVISTALSSIFGAVTLIPLIVIQGVAKGVNPFYFPIKNVLPQFLYISIVLTGFAYLCYFTSMSHLETSTGSMAFLIKPPLASIFSSIFLGEVITKNIVIGIILIIVGMFVAMKLKSRPENQLEL